MLQTLECQLLLEQVCTDNKALHKHAAAQETINVRSMHTEGLQQAVAPTMAVAVPHTHNPHKHPSVTLAALVHEQLAEHCRRLPAQSNVCVIQVAQYDEPIVGGVTVQLAHQR